MLSRGGCGGLGALMVIQGGVLGAVGAGGTSPIPKISPHPGGGRERGAFLCRQLSRWGGWKCIPLGGRDGSWGGLDRDGGNKRHMLDPPRAYWALFYRLGWGRKRVPVGRPTRRPPAQLVPLRHLPLSPGGLRPPGSGHKGFAELGWAAAPSAPPSPAQLARGERARVRHSDSCQVGHRAGWPARYFGVCHSPVILG